MNVNFEKLPHVNPCEAFEHVRGRYIAQGFWRGVWTTLIALVLVGTVIGYAVHQGGKEPATGPIGDAPPLPTTEAVVPLLPGDSGTPSKTATVPDVPGPPPIPGLPPGVKRK